MLQKMRQRAKSEKGFTLIELLVVILIIGILAAIAIPSFLAQKSKANDASAKELARTAQTTAETYATGQNGSYANMTAAILNGIEPTIPTTTAAAGGSAYLGAVALSSDNNGYTVLTVSQPTGDTFSVTRNDDGTVLRTCTVASLSNTGGCPNATTATPTATAISGILTPGVASSSDPTSTSTW